MDVQVRVSSPDRVWGEGIRRSAGIAADVPGFDEAFEQVQRDRELATTGTPMNELPPRYQHLLGPYPATRWCGPSLYSTLRPTLDAAIVLAELYEQICDDPSVTKILSSIALVILPSSPALTLTWGRKQGCD